MTFSHPFFIYSFTWLLGLPCLLELKPIRFICMSFVGQIADNAAYELNFMSHTKCHSTFSFESSIHYDVIIIILLLHIFFVLVFHSSSSATHFYSFFYFFILRVSCGFFLPWYLSSKTNENNKKKKILKTIANICIHHAL